MADFGKLAVALSLNSAGFANGLNQSMMQVQRFAQQIQQQRINLPKVIEPKAVEHGLGEGVEGIVGKLKGGFASAAAFLGIEVAGELAKAAMEWEGKLAKTAARGMLLEGTLGASAAKDIKNLQLRRGGTFAGEAGVLNAAGIDKSNIAGVLEQLDTIAKAVETDRGGLVAMYGAINEEGSLSFKHLKSLTAQNIPIVEALAQQLGKTNEQILRMGESGQISAYQFQKAFGSLASEDGLLSKVADKQETQFDLMARGFDANNPKWKALKATPYLGAALGPVDDLTTYLAVKLRSGLGMKDISPGDIAGRPAGVNLGLAGPSIDEAAGKRWLAMQQQGMTVIKSLRSPTELYAAEVDRLQSLMDQGAISAGTFYRALSKLVDPATKLAGPVGKGLAEPWDKLKNAGEQLEQSTLTPLEKYQNQLTELDTMLKRGAIGQETFDRAAMKAKQDLEAGLFENKPAGIAERGSQEAFAAIRRFREGDNQPRGIQEVVEAAKRQEKLQREIRDELKVQNKLVQIQF